MLERVRALEEEVGRLRARVQEARAEGEELFHAFMKHSPLTAFIKDEAGRLLYVNPAFESAFAFNDKVWLQKTDFELWPEETARQLRENDEEILRSGLTRTVSERVVHKDGPHDWLTTKFRFRDSHGAYFLGGMGLDVTEQNRLRSLLDDASRNESIGKLAGGVAHDFNNLLTSIIGNCELARDRVEEGSTLFEHIQDILTAADQAAGLTRQLLGFARRQVIVPRVLSLNPLIEQMLPILRRLLSADIDFRFIPEEALSPVKMDPRQVEQLVLNLVVNASDAMPQGGRLTVETNNLDLDGESGTAHALAPGRYALLVVRDTGTGMTQETQARIFEPFFTTKELGRGTGLGLAMCDGIVKQNGGHISVQSELGRGTAFEVCLPCVDSATAVAELERPKAFRARPEPTARGETLLVVDDDPMVRDVTVRILSRLGHPVLAADGGEAALTLARSHPGPIHLLVSDVIMLGMRGPDLLEALRAIRPEIACIFISGYTADALSAKDVDCGDVVLLEKPFQAEALARKVAEALSGRQRA